MEATFDYQVLPDRLLPWFREHARALPWRNDREPYHVWLSEIMLQQTRVETVKGYYARFLAALPTVKALADAPMEQVQKLWEGLGYYSRAQNLQKAAQVIVTKHHGQFPNTYEQLLALPGIGTYTAGAIASICFDLATPAVDGNVLRVIARLTGLEECVDDQKVKSSVREQLAAVYPKGSCGAFTQSLMELGEVVCVPNGAPTCDACPFSDLCFANKTAQIQKFPIRAQKRARREEELTVFLLQTEDGRIAIRRRPENGLLANLWELPHADGFLTEQAALEAVCAFGCEPIELIRQLHRRHIFTHVTWQMRCYALTCRPGGDLIWAPQDDLKSIYALPTAFRQFLDT